MNKVTYYAPSELIRKDVVMAGIKEDVSEITKFWEEGGVHNYVELGTFFSDAGGEEAAEEAFDLSNNPSREDERVLVQGRTQSLSVGGVVRVCDISYKNATFNYKVRHFMCLNVGWKEL